MNAAVAGIVDARNANIHGGIVAGVYNRGISKADPPTSGGPRA